MRNEELGMKNEEGGKSGIVLEERREIKNEELEMRNEKVEEWFSTLCFFAT